MFLFVRRSCCVFRHAQAHYFVLDYFVFEGKNSVCVVSVFPAQGTISWSRRLAICMQTIASMNYPPQTCGELNREKKKSLFQSNNIDA